MHPNKNNLCTCFLCRHWVSGHLSFVKGSTPGNSIDLPICLSSICCWHFFFLHYSSVTYWLIHTNLSERITYTGKAELAFFQMFLKDLPSSSQSCISLGIVHNMYRADLNAFCCSKFPESSRKKKIVKFRGLGCLEGARRQRKTWPSF